VAGGGDRGFVSVGGRAGFPAYYFQPGAPVWGLSFRPDARRLAAVGEFSGVREWATDTPMDAQREGQRPEPRILAPSGPSHSDVRYSPDGARLYVGSAFDDDDIRVRVLDAGPEGRGELAALRGHSKPVRGLDLSPDGTRLATGSYDRTLRMWDVAAGRELWQAEFDEDVNGVAFHPAGDLVAAGIDDGVLAVLEVASGRTLARFPAHQGHISAVAFSPRGALLATGGREHRIRLYDLAALGDTRR
jgi:WD40 repeat protein